MKANPGDLFRIQASNVRGVKAIWSPKPVERPDALSADIRNYWESVKNEHIYNGELARLVSWVIADDILKITLGLTDYQTLLYSNNHIEKIASTWGEQFFSRALGISALVVTSDNYLLLMQRSSQVGEYPNCIDTFGGHIGIVNNRNMGVHKAMLLELKEELDISPGQVKLKCIGLLESMPNRKPELGFSAYTLLTMRQLVLKAENAQDRFEYEKLILLPLNTTVMNSFLETQKKYFSPSAFGLLNLFFKNQL